LVGGEARAQAYRLVYLPLSEQTALDLSSSAFPASPAEASKPVFDANILQGLGDEDYVLGLADPAGLAKTVYLEGRIQRSETGLNLALASASVDLEALKAFASRMDASLSAVGSQGLLVLNLAQGSETAVSALHLLVSDLANSLQALSLVLVLSQADDTPNAADFADAATTLRRILTGYADRAPFGNDDSQVTPSEVESYLLRMTDLKPRLVYARVAAPADSKVLTINPNLPRDARDEIGYQRELAEAQFSIIMEDGGALTTYLASCEFCPQREQARKVSSQLQQSDARLLAETQLAKRVIASEKPEALEAYLKTCEICPRRAEAESLLFSVKQNQAREEESQQWQSAKRFGDALQITNYLTSCRFCEFQVEAVALRETLLSEAEDQSAWDEARALGSEAALRGYIQNCSACNFKPVAQVQLDQVLAASRKERELASFRTALADDNLQALRAYLDTCEFCEQKAAARAKLDALQAKMQDQIVGMMGDCRLVAPRIKARGLVLSAEALGKAAAACQAVRDLDPSQAEAAVLLARTLIAQGQNGKALDMLKGVALDDYPHGYSVRAWLLLRSEDSANQFDQAVSDLEAGDNIGDPFAALHLSGLILSGRLEGKGPADAFELLQKTANLDNAYSETTLGWMYENGTGTDANAEQAATWYQAAANQGEGTALGYLGSLYETGNGVKRSPGAAADLYIQALDRGSSWVANRLTNQWQDREAELLKAVQVKLKERGLYEGDIDGLFGPGTNAAIRGLQGSKSVTAFPLLGIELKG
jgi:TPR repeat protein